MAGRRVLAGAATLLLSVSLAGCQAGSLGTIGITRTADGALAAVVARCDATLARIEVRHGPKDANAHRTVDLTLEAFRPTKDPLVVVPLSVEIPGWHRAPSTFSPATDERYYVVGTDRARGWSTDEAVFVVTDLPEDLGPDTVLVARPGDGDSLVAEKVSLARFRKDACAA